MNLIIFYFLSKVNTSKFSTNSREIPLKFHGKMGYLPRYFTLSSYSLKTLKIEEKMQTPRSFELVIGGTVGYFPFVPWKSSKWPRGTGIVFCIKS